MRARPLRLAGPLAALVATAFAAPPAAGPSARPAPDPLPIGAVAPLQTLRLATPDGQAHTLAGRKGPRGLVVVFSANTCPWVRRWEDRYPGLAAEANRLGFGMLLVNANAATRATDDAPAAMTERARAAGYTVPYVMDDGTRLADAFGATRTPEVFLFDAAMRLAYHGALDDHAQSAAGVTKPFALDALRAVAAGRAPAPAVTRSLGCTIKRVGDG